jgi:hypothetical protein
MCTVGVAFVPIASGPGSKAAVLSMTSPSFSITAGLWGVGLTAAGLTANPCTLAFGTVAPGSTATRTVTVTNDGATTSGSIQVVVAGADAAMFSTAADTCTNATLANLQTCSVDIVFAPTAAGSRAATVMVSGSPGGAVRVSLSGD